MRRKSPARQSKDQIEIFKRFVETSGQALGMADLEGRIFYANATLCRLLGEEAAEKLYQSDIFSYYGSMTAQRLREEILPVVQREGQWVGELSLIDKQGHTTPTIQNIYLLRDDSGAPLCVANVITDISERIRMEAELRTYRDHLDELVKMRTAELEKSNTLLHEQIAERKRTEEALKSSEERFRRLTENAKDMIFRMSLPDGNYEYVSPAAIDITGYEPVEFYRNPLLIQKVIHPDWSDYLALEFGNLTKGTMAPSYEFKIIHKSGQERWIHQRNALVKDEEGRPLAIEGIVTDITERKQAETALRESETRIREIIDNAPFGAHNYKLLDDGRLIFLGGNPSAARILNLDHTSLIGMRIEEIVPMLGTEIFERLREVTRTGQRWVKDVIQYKDQIITGAFAMFAFQTSPGRMTVFFYDITERKRIEEERSRLMAILESTSDLVATSRPDGGLTYVNAAGRRMLGWDGADEDIRGHNLNEAHPAWALRIVQEEGLPAARTHGIWQGETAVLNREGRETPVSQVIMIHTSGNGAIDYISTIIRDITERKRAEEDLRDNEEKFRTIFESAPMSIAISDLEGRYIDVNARMCERAQLSREVIIGRQVGEIHQLARPEDPAEALRLQEKLIAQGWLSDEEVHLVRPSTKEHMINLLFARLVTIAGKPYVISMLLDITERKHLEEQLFQAQKMESIGRLAGGVAHDFNNLLTAILGNTELAILEKDVGSKAIARLQVVQQASTSAAELTKQLLAFSRKQIIEPKLMDLNELIWNMGKMLARVIGEDVTLRSTNQPGLHPIKVDASQMQQIIMNLAVNARDAMPEGGILTIETADVMLDEAYCLRHGYGLPGEHVMVAVSDTGMGMNAEVKEHLFEPFFTTKALGKGTGLGLATVYGAVKQNNGYIDVYSEPGQGTCFKIYFPAVVLDRAHAPHEPGAEKLPGGSETVLLVEDDPGVLEFTRDALELLGYQVLAASNGEEALSLARDYDDAIALLMTDVKLPGMNGRQLADALVHDRPDLKVLFNSGYTHDTIVHHGVLDQDLHFIGKPFSAHALAHKLRQVLEET